MSAEKSSLPQTTTTTESNFHTAVIVDAQVATKRLAIRLTTG